VRFCFDRAALVLFLCGCGARSALVSHEDDASIEDALADATEQSESSSEAFVRARELQDVLSARRNVRAKFGSAVRLARHRLRGLSSVVSVRQKCVLHQGRSQLRAEQLRRVLHDARRWRPRQLRDRRP